MATYVNDLRLKEIATGDESGTWGTSTNTNLELIAEAFSFGTESITTNADTHTTTIADGATDPGRSIYLQYTGTLDSTCTITIGPNTVSKLWFIENATSGSQSIIIKQGSGATVTIANGQVKAIYSDGAGSGGKMVDAFQDLSIPDLFIDDDLTFTSDSAVITFGADGDTTLTHTDGSGLTLNSTNKIMFNDASQFIQGSSATVLALGATDEIDLTATAIDVNGTMDVSGALTGTTAVFTTADNTSQLTIKSTDDDANAGPVFDLVRDSASPADNDVIGRIRFRGDNDAGEETTMVYMQTNLLDASDGTEDAGLDLFAQLGGTLRKRISLSSTEAVFNEDSQNIDFRVESDGNAGMLMVDGGENAVLIGTVTSRSDTGSSSHSALQMEGTSGASSRFAFTRNQANTSGPKISLCKSRGASLGSVTIVQSGDNLGSVNFNGADGTDIATSAAQILAQVDGTPGSNDMPGRLTFSTTPDGSNSLSERMRINEAGDLLVNTTTDYGGKVNIKSDASGNSESALALVSTLASAADGPILDLNRQTASPADSDNIGIIKFKSTNSADETIRYAEIDTFIQDVTDGTEDGMLRIRARLAGTLRSRIEFDQTETVINEDSQDLDFRVESDGNANMFFVNAGSDRVHIGSASALSVGSNQDFTIQGQDGGAGASIVRNSNDAAAPSIQFAKSRGTAANATTVVQDGDTLGNISFRGADGTDLNTKGADIIAQVDGTPGSNAMPGRLIFRTNDSSGTLTSGNEVFRIDSSRNFLLGTTDNSPVGNNVAGGIGLFPNGSGQFSRDGGIALLVNRKTSDGTIVDFRKDGSTIGNIGTKASRIYIGTLDTGLGFSGTNDAIFPVDADGGSQRDNAIDLGLSSSRFDDIFATNGTIQTSDRNEKQDIEALSAAEQRVAVAAKGLMRKYRWKSKVAEKGDDARIHVGIIAQDLQDAFTAEGLDAARYAMFCSDTWTNDDGSEQTRLGVRYSELFAFIISAI